MISDDTDVRDVTDVPDGPLTSIMYQLDCQLEAATRHAAAEGVDVPPGTILDSYDRVLHPWMHGRRYHDIVERARRWFA